MFKRFTIYIIDFFKEKFVWAKKKSVALSTDAEHDKRIAENYVFAEVQGIYVPRAEYERRARFNSDTYNPIPDEIKRFPSCLIKLAQLDSDLNCIPTISADRRPLLPKLNHRGYHQK
ncbi:hypothetical protein B1209_17120 [Raoultella planticola]|nr:hypothetical protein B1209_17120 [Raoultella planticola]